MRNIIDLQRHAFGSDALARLSTTLHESPMATRRGVEVALPASLVGISSYASTDSRAAELLSALREGEVPHVEADAFAHVVQDDTEASRLAQSGTGFLLRIFGNRLGHVVDALANQTGLSRGSAYTLLGLSAPLLLEALGKDVVDKELDASRFSRYLGDEGRKVSGLLPEPVAHAVYLGTALSSRESQAPRRVSSRPPPAEGPSYAGIPLPELKPRLNPMWIIVPFALLTVFGMWWFHRTYVQRPIDPRILEPQPYPAPGGLKQ